MEKFNLAWIPDQGMSVEDTTDAIKRIQFGNGVVQQQKMVLGLIPKIYNLTFTRKPELIAAIDKFLVQQAGKRFLWEPPMENRQIIVMWSEKSCNRTGFTDTLSVKFTELKF